MRRLLIVVLGSALAACAHHITSVRSSWYVMEESNASVTYEPLAKLAERMKIAWQRKRKGGGGRPFLA
ncbi:hypothetical protein F2P44_25330 [Massilia sp. CCM 8695]|uniref:Lipoprotein n=1 Tax=Massilia frigida TaxID=2609281 RepID=A0ABX0NAV6_9BURK|nr:hypothetical protein [Massilia frigida]NHZ82575.1 hypothetical protein [Massilia frigida]